MKLLLATCITFIVCVWAPFAQRRADITCEVEAIAADLKHWGAHSIAIKQLGQIDVISISQSTTRSLPFMSTGLFVTADISPSPSSQSWRNQDSVALMLIVSRREELNLRKLDLSQVLSLSAAEVDPNNINNVMISTLLQSKEGPWIITMQCRKKRDND